LVDTTIEAGKPGAAWGRPHAAPVQEAAAKCLSPADDPHFNATVGIKTVRGNISKGSGARRARRRWPPIGMDWWRPSN